MLALILLSAVLCFSSQAQDTNILNVISPKLGRFITEHPEAGGALSNALSDAFVSKKLQSRFYYFYSDDPSAPTALHYYPDKSSVALVIRENQQPCDECICLIFEALNSMGQNRFQDLFERAKTGTISKTNFVREVMGQELQALKKTQA